MRIANRFRCRFQVLSIEHGHHYKYFVPFDKEVGTEGELIYLLTQRNCWALVRKEKQIRQRFFCNTCARWLSFLRYSDFNNNHLKLCMRCTCERAYKKGDSHPVTCRKNSYRKYYKKKKDEQEGEIKLAEKIPLKENEEIDCLSHHHFADFETFPRKLDNKFIVYASGLLVAGDDSDNVKMDVGPDSLFKFIERIDKLSGILWFFNGSRFDLFFIMEYLIRNRYKVNEKETIITNNAVLVLSIQTSVGTLIIKDLNRFLPGSLKWNCKGFGLGKDDSKLDFDHNKIKSWEDVEREKEEMLKYLSRDVSVLRELWKRFSEPIAKQFKIQPWKEVGISGVAHAAWTTTIESGLVFKAKRGAANTVIREGWTSQEEDFGAAYYGGRVPNITPIWKHPLFNQLKGAHEYGDQQSIDDIYDFFEIHTQPNDLGYHDINSLYPSQMYGNLFPCGAPTKHYISSKLASDCIIRQMEKESKMIEEKGKLVLESSSCISEYQEKMNEKGIKKLIYKVDGEMKWKYRLLKVDITCPKNLYVAFLMDRDKKTKKNIQNLEDKIGIWHTGAELLEAITLGYKITAVYEYYVWPKVAPLFQKFIEFTNFRKSCAEKDTPDYEVNKLLANALSGKHGQKTQPHRLRLLIGDEITHEHLTQSNQQNIYSDDGSTLAVCVETPVDADRTPFALINSVFILSYARVWVSRFMRACKSERGNAYTDPEIAPIEGDTDSLVQPRQAFINVDPIWFGKSLGQMKDEMPGEFILYQANIAPKTKIKIYLTQITPEGPKNKDNQCLEKVTIVRGFFKSKGIPHPREIYDPFHRKDLLNPYQNNQPYYDFNCIPDEVQEMIRIKKFLAERETTKQHYNGTINIGKPMFNIQNKTGNQEFRTHLTCDDIENAIKGNNDILCLFGGMIRNLKNAPHVDDMGIFPDYVRRSVKSQNWWEDGKNRIIDPDTFPYGITYPIGFEK